MAETFNGVVSVTPESSTDVTVTIDGGTADLTLGGAGGQAGLVTLKDVSGQARVTLDAAKNRLRFFDSTGAQIAEVGPSGNIILGGAGNVDGDITLRDGSGTTRITLDAQNHRLRFFDGSGNSVVDIGPNGNIVMGGAGGVDGDLILRDGAGIDRVSIDGQNHRVIFRDDKGHEMGRLGEFANLKLGSGGHDGDILLFPGSAADMSDNSKATIHLDANAGDITLRNADCAEEFEVDAAAPAEPGTVMALAADGKLRPSRRAHDRGVVGVVSGAGAFRPGIVLDRRPGEGLRRPIALVGKTYVRVTDEAGPIAVGDLLTASSSPGVAMKAVDPLSAFGAVIGKALAPHEAGEGMIPMVIALQ